MVGHCVNYYIESHIINCVFFLATFIESHNLNRFHVQPKNINFEIIFIDGFFFYLLRNIR